jgi:hypothetical protein
MIDPAKPEVSTLCCGILSRIILNNISAAMKFHDVKGTKQIMKCLQPNVQNADLKTAAVHVICSFTENTRFNRDVYKEGFLPVLVQQLAHSTHDQLLFQSLWAFICIFQDDKNAMDAIYDAKVLPHLMRLITSAFPKVQFYALMNVRLLSRGLGNKVNNEVLKANCVPVIIKLLESSDLKVRMQVAGCVFELAKDNKKVQDILMAHSPTKEIIEGLQHPEDNMKYWCLGIVWLSCREKSKLATQRQQTWLSAGALEAVLALRSHHSDNVRRAAIYAANALEGRVSNPRG